jgi:uncharacterized RDD family membrane protein YckC
MSGPGQQSAPTPEQPAAPPPGPAPSAPPPSAPGWTSALTSTAPTPGPAGLFYADVPNRIIAYVIDAIIVGIVSFIVSVVIFGIVGSPTTVTTVVDPNALLGVRFDTQTNIVPTLLYAIFGIGISAGYFIYTWTAMRGTLGMRMLGMQVGNAANGATLTTDQAVRRWLALGGIFSLAQTLNPLPLVGLLIGLASLIYVIYLLVTTAQSPTKQGFHDKFAGTIVAKAARSVA